MNSCPRKTKFGSIILKTNLLGAHGKTYMSTPTSTTRVQLHSAPRLLVTRPHGLYVNLAVRRGYSSLGRSGSTSTTPYAATTSFSGRTTTSTTHLDWFQLENYSRTAPATSTTSRIHLRLVDFSNNRRGSITDRHGFVDSRPRIKLSHLFQ
jgi:hypothetical protein